jgi:hypothetical protein
MALISAILVMLVVTVLGIGAISIAEHSLNSTVVSRKQVQSVGGAEAGINLGLNGLQSSVPPCSMSGTLTSGPTTSTYSVAITYYPTASGTGSPLSCSAVQAGTSIPLSAELTSTGNTAAAGFGSRVMHALVAMTAVPSPAFDKAIFAQGTLTFNNKSTINGDGKNNADVYTNTTFTCTNNEYFYGNLYSQGDITGSNTCGTSGDWWAAGRISATGNGTVGGTLKAGGCNDTSKGCSSSATTSGNIGLSSNYSVAKDAIAKGTISPTPCGSGHVIQGTCSTSANPGNPPYYPFPTVDYNALAWSQAGYTVHDLTLAGCPAFTPATLAAYTSPAVVLTNCNVDWGKNTWTFNTDIAVLATGGFGSTNQVNFQSGSSTSHNFYMIVPSHLFGTQTATTCSSNSGNIKFTNQTTIDSGSNPLVSFIYTPCAVTINNNQSEVGQVYGGGNVAITNQFNMNYKSLTVPGAVGGTGAAPVSYAIGLIYTREG